MQEKILIIGSTGQIGTELFINLQDKFGTDNVVASDIKESKDPVFTKGHFEIVDVLNLDQLKEVVAKHSITQVYLLAALLSATAEKNPDFAWKLNMEGLFNVLNLAKDGIIHKIFWPSSIAVFGPTSPKINTPQDTVMQPTTVYGISKLAGEQWCNYYHTKYGVDVRSIRYPGLIGYKSAPGGGTTDYAVDIFYKAKESKKYTCFLSQDSGLPMMYMPDAIRATIKLMDAPKESIKIRSSYNLAGISFTPKDIADEIKKHVPDFEMSYNIDFRDAIAKSWPTSINDDAAQLDWDWNPKYNLPETVYDMLKNITMS
ncbi:MAG: nucleoside-diphosphate-sugar epimerase [Flavobacteriales bacterium]|jgi:nucleoside-diphosphate-sugar epimerase